MVGGGSDACFPGIQPHIFRLTAAGIAAEFVVIPAKQRMKKSKRGK
jgi:hypothetical protein